MQSPVTLTDVARHAGVSLATASRVLNGSVRTVGGALRHRVLEAAAELGYTPNIHAQAMARGASNMVGLVLHDIADPYFSAIASGVTRMAEEHGLVVLLASTLRRADREVEYMAMMRAQRARAVIIAGTRSASRKQNERLAREITAFRAGGGRVAAITQNRLGTDTVLPENRSGARALARQLVGLGHRRFAVLGGPRELLTARDRVTGFREGVGDAGEIHVVHGPFTRDGGYDVAGALIDEGLGATCIFAVNDVMALGATAALRQRGIRIPDDVSVAGFDDIETLRDLVPPLTTVRLPLQAMGRCAAEMILSEPPSPKPCVVRISGEVVLRESTRRIA